jgi:hypothetical protein
MNDKGLKFEDFISRGRIFESIPDDNITSINYDCEYKSKSSNRTINVGVYYFCQKDEITDAYSDYINRIVSKDIKSTDIITSEIATKITPKISYDLIGNSTLEKLYVVSRIFMNTSGSYISREDEDPLSAFAKNKVVPDHVEVLTSIAALRFIKPYNAQKIYDISKEFIIKEYRKEGLSIKDIEESITTNKEHILKDNLIALNYSFIGDQLVDILLA